MLSSIIRFQPTSLEGSIRLDAESAHSSARNMMSAPKPIALTMGEPAGIGPDITIGAWIRRNSLDVPPFLVIGDNGVLEARARALDVDIAITRVFDPATVVKVWEAALPVMALNAQAPVTAGRPAPASASLVIASIEHAVGLVLKATASAMVTNPIHKQTLYNAGFAYPGHTEFLAALAGKAGYTARPVMMVMAPGLKVVPITIHIPLREVAKKLRTNDIIVQTRIVARDLARFFALARPRIAVTGLNPHAGEYGSLGGEERDIIEPALEQLRHDGLDVAGPFPADTLFHEQARSAYDVCICMYHDQALIPVKMLGFHDGVNCTLGLPFVRTSPDHGTALTLAGSGRADPSSLIAALKQARNMAASA